MDATQRIDGLALRGRDRPPPPETVRRRHRTASPQIPFQPLNRAGPSSQNLWIHLFPDKLKAHEEPLAAHQRPSTENKRSINNSLMVRLMTQEFRRETQANIWSVLNEASSGASDVDASGLPRFKETKPN